jgi:hypothetical protein
MVTKNIVSWKKGFANSRSNGFLSRTHMNRTSYITIDNKRDKTVLADSRFEHAAIKVAQLSLRVFLHRLLGVL